MKSRIYPQHRPGSYRIPMVIGLVSAGMGIAVVPTAAKRLFNLDVVYKEIEDFPLRAEWITAHRKDNRNPALKHFIEISDQHS
ncbi:LysR substrate-binding domain-containing protein [Bacillus licheniformis]|nr:LysR substrate-binding domain-containing protein [Bacillus licheniformis]